MKKQTKLAKWGEMSISMLVFTHSKVGTEQKVIKLELKIGTGLLLSHALFLPVVPTTNKEEYSICISLVSCWFTSIRVTVYILWSL